MKRIRTEGLSRIYGQGDTKVAALCDVNLDISPGEFTAFVGPSGSGKSTLLHLLGGLDQPSSGRMWVGDRDLYAMREKERAVFPRRKFGFVFQSFNLVPVLTAEENIIMPLLLDGQASDPAWFRELTSMLGITDRLRHLPGQLSGGQQQRVAIARALITRPPVVFADEPTGNLDTAIGMSTEQMRAMLLLEGLVYGLRALLFGLPAGIGMSALVMLATKGLENWQPPLVQLVIASVCALALCLLATLFPVGRLAKVSIVESLGRID